MSLLTLVSGLCFLGDYVIVKCVASNSEFDLTHYMVFANGQNTIYMGTYTVSEPTVGELRYIFRLTGLTKTYPTYSWADVSDTSGGTAIEGSDVYQVGSQTRSKFCEFSTSHLVLRLVAIRSGSAQPGEGRPRRAQGKQTFCRESDRIHVPL